MFIFCWVYTYLTQTVPWNYGTLFYHKKNHPKYALTIMSPAKIIWPILHRTVVWLWNQFNCTPWNLCGWKCKTNRLHILVNPCRPMMINLHTVENYHYNSVYKKKGKNKWLMQWIFTKLHNTMYVTLRCKNMCSTLYSTTVTTQIIPAPYNVLGSLKNELTH